MNSRLKRAASNIGSNVTLIDVSVTSHPVIESHPLNSGDKEHVVSVLLKLPGLTFTSSIWSPDVMESQQLTSTVSVASALISVGLVLKVPSKANTPKRIKIITFYSWIIHKASANLREF